MQRTVGHCDSWRNPDDLRFTKGNINLNFPIVQLQCQNIYDVLYALESGKLIPRDIPSLRVISHEGQLWTLDNKLLYICRISPKVKRVSVAQVSGQKFLDKLLDANSPAAMRRMSTAEFFPRVDKCDKSPRGELTSRADRVRLSTVKKILEKEKIRGKRSSAPKSSSSGRAVSSSTTTTSRISSANTESRTAFSVESTCAQNSGSKTSSSLQDVSSTDSSGPSSEDTVETKAECYPAVRSMTGNNHSENSVRISTLEGHEHVCTRRGSSIPSSLSERRPSTCQDSPRFSRNLQRFPSAPRASRLVRMNSSDTFARLEPRPSKSLQSGDPTDSPSSAAIPDDSRELVCLGFFASSRDHGREVVSPRVCAKLGPGEYFPENVPHSIFSRFQDNISGKYNVTQSFSAKSPINCRENSPEGVSQGLFWKLDIDRDDPDDDFELEAFALPEFCSHPFNLRDSKCGDGEEIPPLHTCQRPNHGTSSSSSRDHLDRSVSSCSSSTERPMNNNKPQHSGLPNKGEPRRKGSETNNSSLLRTFSLLQKSNIGRSLSPLRRASVSAGRSMKCHLSAEHEFEVSKQILLKHMKKAFFSVC